MDKNELLKMIWYDFPKPAFVHSTDLPLFLAPLLDSNNYPVDDYPAASIAAHSLAKLLEVEELTAESLELEAQLQSVVLYEGKHVRKSLKADDKYFATMIVHLPYRDGVELTVHYNGRSSKAYGSGMNRVHTFFGECELITGDNDLAGLCLVFGLKSSHVWDRSPSFLYALVKTRALIRPWLDETSPALLVFILSKTPAHILNKDGTPKLMKQHLVIIELLKKCGLELHFAKIRTAVNFSLDSRFNVCKNPLASDWKTLDGKVVPHFQIATLRDEMIVHGKEKLYDSLGLVVWPMQKKLSLFDFPFKLRNQNFRDLRFLVHSKQEDVGCEIRRLNEVLKLCLDWKQKELALSIIRQIGIKDFASLDKTLERAVLAYGWVECDGDRFVHEFLGQPMFSDNIDPSSRRGKKIKPQLQLVKLQMCALLNFCMKTGQKQLTLSLIRKIDSLKSMEETLATAISIYGWAECDGNRLIHQLVLSKDNLEPLATLAINLENRGFRDEANLIVDLLWSTEAGGTIRSDAKKGRRSHFLNGPGIVLFPHILQAGINISDVFDKAFSRVLPYMRKTASLIQLKNHKQLIDIFKNLIIEAPLYFVHSPAERIRSAIWLGDASTLEIVMMNVTGKETYLGDLLRDADFTMDECLSSCLGRRWLRRLLEMRLAFCTNEPEYTGSKESKISYAEAYDNFKRLHDYWLSTRKEICNLKDILQVLDYLDDCLASTFSR